MSTLEWTALEKLADEHGASFYVLSGARFRANFKALRDAFSAHYPDVNIGYSYKTNYTPQLCRIVHELGGYAEVVSDMEYELARRLGIPGPRIIFNGPYKGETAFADAALAGAILNLDSLRDVSMLESIAVARPDRTFEVGLRCNFALHSGETSRFGMDVDGSDFRAALSVIADNPNLSLKGLHCHFPDRDLDSFGRRAEGMVRLVRQVFPDSPPDMLNIGGGFFSHMPESLRATFDTPPASFEDYGALVGGILSNAFRGARKMPALFLEPGTALVADTQVFYTRVISIKTVRGHRFATVAGSSFDISPTARSRNLPVTPVLRQHRSNSAVPHHVVGYTCIENDILTEDLVAALEVGDFLCYENVGSYSVVMRPPFILPANPILFDDGDGILYLIKARQSNEDVFRNYIF